MSDYVPNVDTRVRKKYLGIRFERILEISARFVSEVYEKHKMYINTTNAKICYISTKVIELIDKKNSAR